MQINRCGPRRRTISPGCDETHVIGGAMFKYILIPTDGSATAAKAVAGGVELAKQLGARVTGYHACEPAGARVYGEGYMIGPRDVAHTAENAREAGEKFVALIADAAR